MIRSGKLRHTVIIQEPDETGDELGQPVKTWIEFAKVRASVEPLQGREFFSAGQYNSEVTVRIRMRYIEGVTTKMRVSFKSKIYNIEAPINFQERDIELQLMCSEGVNDG